MRKQTTIALLAMLCFAISLPAQKSKMKKAQKYMESLNYNAAIPIYLKVAKKKGHTEAKIALANAYLKNKDYINAEIWYGRVIQLSEAESGDFLQYGKVLLHNGKCKEAQTVFNQFLKQKPYDLRKPFLTDVCAYIQELKEKNPGITSIDLPVNNYFLATLVPAFYQNGLVFGGIKPIDSLGRKNVFDLFFVEFEGKGADLSFGEPHKFSTEEEGSTHHAIASFSANEEEMYLTQNRSDVIGTGVIPLEIVFSRKNALGAWDSFIPLPFNNKTYSVAHPAISPDGYRLFFSSDMPGGFGGKDIYVSMWEDGDWRKPVNLGPTINTAGDELFPHYREDGRLFFASDGHLGLGGQDIFVVNEQADGLWGTVENLGTPMNSAFDDFSIIFDMSKKSGFFTSNRKERDRIYYFKSKEKTNIVFAAIDENSKVILKGVNVESSCPKMLIEVAENGLASLQITDGDCCEIFLKKEGYEAKMIRLCSDDIVVDNTLFWEMKKEKPLIAQIKGRVIDQFSGQAIHNALLKLETTASDEIQEIRSNYEGNYSFDLPAGHCYQLKIEKVTFFSKTIEQSYCVKKEEVRIFEVDVYLQPFERTVKADSEMIVANNEEASTFEISQKVYDNDNSVSYLLNIYYDSGRASVRKEAIPELKKLLKLLKENPQVTLEISSHTDAKGTTNTNKKLSQRRATAIVKWLIYKGISKDQLIAKGYGESQPVNGCIDGVDCSEEEYQLNRRTEFKVLGDTDTAGD